MRLRLALAFLVSIALIGVASWSRFAVAEKTPANIVAIEQPEISGDDYDEILRDFLEPKTATSTPSEKGPLSSTDLIGRGLIMDYIGLAASGQATEASIATLANQYVTSIPALSKAQTISYSDLKKVTDTKINFQNYADELIKIHNSYAEIINGTNLDAFTNLNPNLYSMASTLGQAYIEAASKLKSLPVPTSLIQVHLQLVNSYFSSAAAMNAISGTETDSAAAFAGLITLNDNLTKEDAFLSEISQILTSNGI